MTVGAVTVGGVILMAPLPRCAWRQQMTVISAIASGLSPVKARAAGFIVDMCSVFLKNQAELMLERPSWRTAMPTPDRPGTEQKASSAVFIAHWLRD